MMDGALKRDPALMFLFGAAFLLVLFNLVSALLFAKLGMAFFGMVKASMWLTAGFAIAGASFGVMRRKRRGAIIQPGA